MMVWPFKKTIVETPTAPVKPSCSHKNRDFHWYIEGEYDAINHSFEIRVVEPYVCVWCGYRENKILQTITREGCGTKKEMIDITQSLIDTYGDRIQPRALVEDEIADMQLVDRDYLRALALLHPEKLNGMDKNAKVALQTS